jgi:flagellar biosynthesis protein FlhF
MELKTFRAHSMADALAEVKKDLGRDAVILHTRTYKVGGVLGVGSKNVVEITASDGTNAPANTHRPRARAARVPEAPDPLTDYEFTPERFAPLNTPSAGGGTPEQAPTPSVNRPAPRPTAPVEVSAPVQRVASPAPIDYSRQRSLEDEIAGIKKMMAQVLTHSRHAAVRARRDYGAPEPAESNTPALTGMSDVLFERYMRLIDQQLSTELAERVAGSVRDELTPSELGEENTVHMTVHRYVAGLISATGQTPAPGKRSDGRPATIALIGPTGVGKTTTVAKLAATYKLKHGQRVGLVTSDTYRIAAVEQLRTYANIIGLPLKVVLSPQEILDACDALNECDVILIDTAGRSQNDAAKVDELRQFIDAAQPHEKHLVLSTTSNEQVLLAAAERFKQVGPDNVIFTKLDEAEHLGLLFNLVHKVGLPMSFITTGQEVPDHISLAQPDRLARILLDGGSVR